MNRFHCGRRPLLRSCSNQMFMGRLSVRTGPGTCGDVAVRSVSLWAASPCHCLCWRSSLPFSDDGSDASPGGSKALEMSPSWWAAGSRLAPQGSLIMASAVLPVRCLEELRTGTLQGGNYLSLERVLNPEGCWFCSTAFNGRFKRVTPPPTHNSRGGGWLGGASPPQLSSFPPGRVAGAGRSCPTFQQT